MKKIDLKKQFAPCYTNPAGKITIITAPEFGYLAIDGKGDPNTSINFQHAIETLYTVSYTLKFMVKKGGLEIDYGVMPLEGQWYMENMAEFCMERKAEWLWTIMIMQPDFITEAMVKDAVIKAGEKKTLVSLPLLRFEKQCDGLSAQILHTGPYSEEVPTIKKLHAFIAENGYQLTGRHREIYLNDMRRTAPAKLKTIIRQPILQAK